ncbi:MAG: co-chaperone GroES [Alphaproteobacteria bacterium]|nr:MAG: co-chaperone GroES [Alphaproteobacteria bacterium]
MSVIEPKKCRPLHDRILVEREEQEQKTKGGIIIPDTAKEKPSVGKVLSVGKGAKDKDGGVIPMDVKVGDRVLFAKWGGTALPGHDEKYMIIKESDVLSILD